MNKNINKNIYKFLLKKLFEKYDIPYEIKIIIMKQLMALKIQKAYKKNRPLNNFEIGDRVYIRSFFCNMNNIFCSNYKIKYGTIIKVHNNFCKIQLLPKPIPLWRKSNMNFWNNHNERNEINENNFFDTSHSILNYNINQREPIVITFPYYMPLPITVLNRSIFKLHKWNSNPYSIVKPIKNTIIKY